MFSMERVRCDANCATRGETECGVRGDAMTRGDAMRGEDTTRGDGEGVEG